MLAREYGFAGWQDLRAAVIRLEGKSLEWAAAEAERAIHGNNVERLAQLIQEYPAVLSGRGDLGESLLGFATGSFGDSGNGYRSRCSRASHARSFYWTLVPQRTRRYG